MQAEKAWKAVLGQLEMEYAKATFDTWMKDTKFIAFEDHAFVIGTSNSFARNWLEKSLTGKVTRKLSELMGEAVEVRFVFWVEPKTKPIQNYQKRESKPVVELNQPTQPKQRQSRYSFENFVVGSSNQLAHAAAMSVWPRSAMNWALNMKTPSPA